MLKDNDLLWSKSGINKSMNVIGFSSNGEFLAAAGKEYISFFNPISGELLSSRYRSSTGRIALFPKNKYLCICKRGKLIIRDIVTWKKYMKLSHRNPIGRRNDPYIESLVISPNEEYIIGGAKDIQVWDFPSGNVIHRLEGHGAGGSIGCLAISPNNSFLISGSYHLEEKDNEIRIWYIGSGELLKCIKDVGYIIESIHFLPDGKKFICSVDSNIEIRDFPSGNVLKTLDSVTHPEAMIITPDGKFVIYPGTHKKGTRSVMDIRIRIIESGKLVQTYDFPLYSCSLSFSQYGNLIAASGWTGNEYAGEKRFFKKN